MYATCYLNVGSAACMSKQDIKHGQTVADQSLAAEFKVGYGICLV